MYWCAAATGTGTIKELTVRNTKKIKNESVGRWVVSEGDVGIKKKREKESKTMLCDGMVVGRCVGNVHQPGTLFTR